ncbi:MAG TPA: hypothetical protein PK263_00670 [bacterium]|nr:hypothetical protein [bacterium]
MKMTKTQWEKLEQARNQALKNPPTELADLMIDMSKSKNKKGLTQILFEMRYGDGKE